MAPSVRGRQVNLGRMMMMVLERMWGDDSLSFSLVRKLKRRGKALLCLRRSVSSQRIPSTQVPVSVLEVCARFYKCVRLEVPKGGSADWKADNNRVKEREGEIVKHSAAFPVSGRARERERERSVWRVCVCVWQRSLSAQRRDRSARWHSIHRADALWSCEQDPLGDVCRSNCRRCFEDPDLCATRVESHTCVSLCILDHSTRSCVRANHGCSGQRHGRTGELLEVLQVWPDGEDVD